MRRVIVVGCGNVLRGDDGLGIAAVRLLRERLRAEGDGGLWLHWRLEVVEAGGPGLALLDLLAGAETALIVDAIAGGATPGTIHRRDGGVLASTAAHKQRRSGALSAHDCDLATVLALGRTLFPEQWPGTVAVWGIEPASVCFGEGLSAPVAAVLPALVARIHGELAATLAISCSAESRRCRPNRGRTARRRPVHSRGRGAG